jgi:CubicO group peptidase (beta-lactamase class C family)
LNRRTFVGGAIALLARQVTIPVTGDEVPGLKPFDQLLLQFMRENQVPGCSLAVGRRGELVYARGFGFADEKRMVPVTPRWLFRIASVSKPVTAVAVMQLVQAGKIALDEPVLKYVNAKVNDPRWQRVTILHCLQHRSGMDREKSGDPIGAVSRISKDLNVPYPVSAESVMRWTMSRPLDHDPGTKMAYSNIGYLILGRVIEAASGKKYEDYVKESVLKPVGVERITIGHAVPALRPVNEVQYIDRKHRTGPSLFPPNAGAMVPLVDGGMNIEGFEAHGGWIATASDLVRFAGSFDRPAGPSLLNRQTTATMFARPAKETGSVWYGCGWQVRTAGPNGTGRNTWHSGLLVPGTSSLLVRRWDGLCWAVLFNTDSNPKGQFLADLIDGRLHRAADAVTAWP